MEEILNKLANNKVIYLKVRTVPQAAQTKFIGFMADESLKIAVSATPEQGKANQALLKFLAKELKIEIKRINIVSGTRTRIKLLKIAAA